MVYKEFDDLTYITEKYNENYNSLINNFYQI